MSITLSIVVIAINLYLVVGTVRSSQLHWSVLGSIGFVSVFYFLFCIYLIIHMIICMGGTWFLKFDCIRRYVAPPTNSYDLMYPTINT